MSTLPHDATNRADSASPVTRQPTGQEFDAIVRKFEAVTDEVGMARPAAAELRELCRQVVHASRRIFPGEVKIRVGRDREIADDVYFVVDVWTSGTPDEIVARANEWHLAEHKIAGIQWRLFCLSFHVIATVRVATEIADIIRRFQAEPSATEIRNNVRAYARDVLRIPVEHDS